MCTSVIPEVNPYGCSKDDQDGDDENSEACPGHQAVLESSTHLTLHFVEECQCTLQRDGLGEVV